MNPDCVIGLLSSHDALVVQHESDIPQLLQHLSLLRSHDIIGRSSDCALQPIVSCAHQCLQASTTRLAGLVILDSLVSQCSSDYLASVGSSWMQQLLALVKVPNVKADFFPLCCKVLAKLLARLLSMKQKPFASQVTPITPQLLTTLIDCCKINPDVTLVASSVVRLIQTHCSGACGAVSRQLEAWILNSPHPLPKCFALLPRAGGAGKEGVQAMQAWDKLLQRSLASLKHLVGRIVGVRKPHEQNVSSEDLLPLPSEDPDWNLLRKMTFWSRQLQILSRYITELLVSSFPYAKSVRPGSVFKSLEALLRVRMSDLCQATEMQLESELVALILPDVWVSALAVLSALVRSCGTDLVVFVPDFLRILTHTISQLGSADPPRSMRLAMLEFISDLAKYLGASCGIEFIASTVIPFLIKAFHDDSAKAVVTLTKPKTHQHATNGGLSSGGEHRLHGGQEDFPVINAGLRALGHVIRASGSLLPMSVHKDLQCLLLCLALDPWWSPCCQEALLTTLLTMITCPHPRWPVPLQFAIKIFRSGCRNAANQRVVSICKEALSVCEAMIHPRSATLQLELPFSDLDLAQVREEVLKVHVLHAPRLLLDNSQPDDRPHSPLQAGPETSVPTSDTGSKGDLPAPRVIPVHNDSAPMAVDSKAAPPLQHQQPELLQDEEDSIDKESCKRAKLDGEGGEDLQSMLALFVNTPREDA